MTMITVAVLYVFFCTLMMLYARKQGRFVLPWFLCALIISPIITFVLLAIFGPTRKKRAAC